MFPDFNKLINKIETFIKDVHDYFKLVFTSQTQVHQKLDSLNAKIEALAKELQK